jgi:hypothetical protein
MNTAGMVDACWMKLALEYRHVPCSYLASGYLSGQGAKDPSRADRVITPPKTAPSSTKLKRMKTGPHSGFKASLLEIVV